MNQTKLRIHTWPEKILKTSSREVAEVTDDIRSKLDEMVILMGLNKGLGLAANQAGLDLRLVVIEFEDKIFKLVNPKIVKSEGSIKITEGCLSFPDIDIEIKRFNKVWVEALDETGQPLVIEADDILAVIFQHEIDHINGIPFIYRISFWQKLKIIPKLNRVKKATKDALRK